MSFTYSSLKTAIQDYTENTETSFVTHLNDFIKISEERILKLVQLNEFKRNASGTTTASNQYLTVPSDFLAPLSLNISNNSENVFLEYKDISFLETFHPSVSVTGVPRFYGVFDVDHLLLAPTPNANFSTVMHYFYRPDSLTAAGDSGTTWLSENASVALLYGTLIEAYTYMKGEPDIMASYEKRFAEAIASLKIFGEAKEVTDHYTTGQIIRQKQ